MTHGEAYGFDGVPTVELAVHFQTHGFSERINYSTFGESGMGDSWGKLAVPYLLAKYVFPACKYVGWTGLRQDELADKTKPYTLELRTNWDRLKVSSERAPAGNKSSREGFWRAQARLWAGHARS